MLVSGSEMHACWPLGGRGSDALEIGEEVHALEGLGEEVGFLNGGRDVVRGDGAGVNILVDEVVRDVDVTRPVRRSVGICHVDGGSNIDSQGEVGVGCWGEMEGCSCRRQEGNIPFVGYVLWPFEVTGGMGGGSVLGLSAGVADSKLLGAAPVKEVAGEGEGDSGASAACGRAGCPVTVNPGFEWRGRVQVVGVSVVRNADVLCSLKVTGEVFVCLFMAFGEIFYVSG